MDYESITFDDDIFGNRKKYVRNIMGVIDELDSLRRENESLVLSIDASWGAGKSVLINMWKNWLLSDENKEKNYAVLKYNAWINDDCENAFIPLVYSLQEMEVYKENIDLAENIKVKSKEFFKSCGIALLKDGVKKLIGEETAKLIEAGIDGAVAENAENFFAKYELFMKQKRDFKDALEQSIPEHGKMIIFVDELDRCRPTFAIETLEVIKHYFNIRNLVFIFATDIAQLSHSISTMYGKDMDSAGYLRRFFDFNIKIPSGGRKEYFESLISDYSKTLTFLNGFSDKATYIFNQFVLSLRDIDKITNNFLLFCMYYKDHISNIMNKPNMTLTQRRHQVLEVHLFFMTLKYKHPETYNAILKEGFEAYDYTKNCVVVNNKYFTSGTIREVVQAVSSSGLNRKRIYKEYCITIYNEEVSFPVYMEQVIELFS